MELLDQLPGTVGVLAGCVKEGFAEGIAVSLLAHAGPLLTAHVLVFLLEVRAQPQQPRPPRGTPRLLQPIVRKQATVNRPS